MSALVVRLVIESCELELIEAPAFAAIVDIMLVPLRYKGPARIMLDPTITEPLTSRDGALTAQENTALPAEIPSRSTPPESARLNVEDAGFIREQVNSDSCSVELAPSDACFSANATVSPVTSDGDWPRGRLRRVSKRVQDIRRADDELPCNGAVPANA